MSKLPTRVKVEVPVRGAMTLTREVEILRGFVWCAGCKRLMRRRSEYQYDHEIARGLGGKDEPSNMRPYCHECHDAKTRRDVALIAKAKRIAGETCAGPTRNPIPKRKTVWPKRKLEGRQFGR